MLKIYAYRNNPIFPYDCDLTRFSEITVRKVTEGFWTGYWEVIYDFNGNIKTDHFPIMTRRLWKAIWGYFRANV
jgi:hypothetical protein